MTVDTDGEIGEIRCLFYDYDFRDPDPDHPLADIIDFVDCDCERCGGPEDWSGIGYDECEDCEDEYVLPDIEQDGRWFESCTLRAKNRWHSSQIDKKSKNSHHTRIGRFWQPNPIRHKHRANRNKPRCEAKWATKNDYTNTRRISSNYKRAMAKSECRL